MFGAAEARVEVRSAVKSVVSNYDLFISWMLVCWEVNVRRFISQIVRDIFTFSLFTVTVHIWSYIYSDFLFNLSR